MLLGVVFEGILIAFVGLVLVKVDRVAAKVALEGLASVQASQSVAIPWKRSPEVVFLQIVKSGFLGRALEHNDSTYVLLMSFFATPPASFLITLVAFLTSSKDTYSMWLISPHWLQRMAEEHNLQ